MPYGRVIRGYRSICLCIWNIKTNNKESNTRLNLQRTLRDSEQDPLLENDWQLYDTEDNWNLGGLGAMDVENLSLTEYLLNFGNDNFASSSTWLSSNSVPSSPTDAGIPSPPESPKPEPKERIPTETKSALSKPNPKQKHSSSARTPELAEKMTVRTQLNPNSLDGQFEVVEERRKRDALAAKQNREKKKKYVSDLENTVEELNRENAGLKRRAAERAKTVEDLQAEISYLKGVITNQSELSAILSSITNASGIKLCSSTIQVDEEVPRKRVKFEQENVNGKMTNAKGKGNAGNGKATENPASSTEGAGVCLHVMHGKVSLEFCANCSKKASTALPIKSMENKENKTC